jgi:hypothetical protein
MHDTVLHAAAWINRQISFTLAALRAPHTSKFYSSPCSAYQTMARAHSTTFHTTFLQAELADRDFTAERYQPVVISTSAHSTLAAEQSAALRAAAEARNVHKLCIPRRPEWDASTTPEQLDAQEKAAFLSWRRYA